MRIKIMSQNVQYPAATDGRWPHLAASIRDVQPDLLMLQEVDWLAGVDRNQATRRDFRAAVARGFAPIKRPTYRQAAERAIGMRLAVAPSRNLPVALGWNPEKLKISGIEVTYNTEMHHGYCAARFDIGLPVPLVAISTHLVPHSAQIAAQEAQLLAVRVHRHGGIGTIAGDINHVPLGDPEIDWTMVQHYNRSARCLPRATEHEPWRSNPIVGQILRDGGLIDIAAYLADQLGNPTLRTTTSRHGRLRVDQAHVTLALKEAIVDYHTLDQGAYSDHFGIIYTLDLDKINLQLISKYT